MGCRSIEAGPRRAGLAVERDLRRAAARAKQLERRLWVLWTTPEMAGVAGRVVRGLRTSGAERRARHTTVLCHVVGQPEDRGRVFSGPTDSEPDRVPPWVVSLRDRALPPPSLAIVDFTDPTAAAHARVDFVGPLSESVLAARSLATIVRLPAGSWTQRLMVYAVRVHPDRPRSTESIWLPRLLEEAERHARRQARWCRQGHHEWSGRFQALLEDLPDGLIPYEVCAESWPGENAFEAAIECVHSWRRSDGHWRLVSMPNRFFAYDMARGENGIWYAAGLFAIPPGQGP